jgi:predicted Fe-Mo cluster-binding NifX family protein
MESLEIVECGEGCNPQRLRSFPTSVIRRLEMKIAMPIWNGSVSNVFDFADQLLVVDAEGQVEVGRSEFHLGQDSIQQRTSLLAKLNVDVLICGGISQSLAQMLTASNIEVIPFVTGPVEEVLEAYFNNRLAEPQFLKPGSEVGARKSFCRRRQRRCRHKNSGKTYRERNSIKNKGRKINEDVF